MRRILYILLLFSTLLFSANNKVVSLKIEGPISPATATFLKEAFLEVKKQDASFVYLALDTPGGLATSMREMIQDILNSKIPVVIYVSPKGARAASAGTFLMYASHVAVMAPGTNIGAATPVNLMQPQSPAKKDEKKDNTLEKQKSAMEKKVINDSIAYIKSIAELRDRNIKWGILAVKEGASISALEAVEKNVIDFMADNEEELFEKLNNFEVTIDKKVIKLDTKNMELIAITPDFKTKFLMAISNPSIAYIFLIVAMYGILFEMMNPGSIFPGVLGSISALIALYALNILPFSVVGLLLIFLGIAFMIAEVFLSGFGILGLAGVVSFAFGSILLFDEKTLGVGVSLSLVIPAKLKKSLEFIL